MIMVSLRDEDELANRLGVDPLEWDNLASRTGDVLLSREWLGLWWKLYQRELPLVSLTTRHADGRLASLLPLVQVRSHLKTLRPLGPWPPAEISLICDPTDADTHAVFLAEELNRRQDWASLQVMGVPADLPFDPGGRGFYAYGQEPNRSVTFAGADWDTYLARRSKNFRTQIRRRDRQLQKDFRVSFRRADDPERLEQDTTELFRLHRLRWPDSSILTPASELFHRQIVRIGLERGWLALWFLELDGHSAACALGFRYGGTETFYQSGRDPAFETSQAGLTLAVHAMRESANSGMAEFRFLGGDQEYKRRLSDTDHPVSHRMYGRNSVGLATVAGFMARGLRVRR